MLGVEREEKRQGGGRSPAAKAEHMTKNIPTAILFKEDGSRPCLLSTGSTSLSFSGMSKRMSTASNMVSQAAGSCTEYGISCITAAPQTTRDASTRDNDCVLSWGKGWNLPVLSLMAPVNPISAGCNQSGTSSSGSVPATCGSCRKESCHLQISYRVMGSGDT